MKQQRRAVYISRIRELLELKRQMEQREISVKELADFVGVSRQTMHLWMSPHGIKTLPASHKQARLEEFFGVSWKQIWQLKEEGEAEGQPVATAAG